jgi:hypothetical protein
MSIIEDHHPSVHLDILTVRGDHRERWAGSALLLAESKFRRVKGYKEIPQLLSALAC